jgi:O-methyltransferase involved in polyketide biosynthesis
MRPILKVVVVAAGFDTRAYRLASLRKEHEAAGRPREGAWEGIQIFEVDLPSASESKQQLMASLGLLDSLDKVHIRLAFCKFLFWSHMHA